MSDTLQSNADDNLMTLSMAIFLSPRSTEPIYVRCNPHLSASSS